MSTNRVILTSKQKALKINLDPDIYGTFAEIGAGQEVVRHFFRAGAASGTIAKAMSAYDKDFSDAIYGAEPHSRYVCESRLRKMLSHEYNLIVERLDRSKHPNRKFFAFADTVTTIDYRKTAKGHGWIGMRFQRHADEAPSDVILHVRLHDNDSGIQQEKIGDIGVNLLYGCYNYHEDPRELLKSLYDNLSRDHIEIDMINMEGPAFKNVDNRLLSLQLVKNGMTEAVMFGPDGKNLQPSDALYKKNILAIRGSFRPVTNVNIDMIMNGYSKFIADEKVDKDRLMVLFEITLNNLRAEGEIDEKDFLDRADILCSLGQTVLISNYQEYYKLIKYFSNFTQRRMGLIMGVTNMLELFKERYYRNLAGGMLEAFGILFMRDLKIYMYPQLDEEKDEVLNSSNCPIHYRHKPLYDYLVSNKRIVDLEDFDPTVLNIYSRKVLAMIKNGESGWEEMVPGYVDNIIKENRLFGYQPKEEVEETNKTQ
ncbi:TonB-dependent receptor [Luteibaculum oceani]|uniref:TonB-dependent receptor n=1 Tax=Luteibaculum oceani TaxID=1294296 RepID=A0A5C6V4H6_9FLAO|nr:TonB-dependent receptor [Luteibaculum oceani]TXC78658.1 TonB-dependent receptor [Luteibaculum oceani]